MSACLDELDKSYQDNQRPITRADVVSIIGTSSPLPKIPISTFKLQSTSNITHSRFPTPSLPRL